MNPLSHPKVKNSAMLGLGLIPLMALIGLNLRSTPRETNPPCSDTAQVQSSDQSITIASIAQSFPTAQFPRRTLSPAPSQPKQSDCITENPFDQSVRFALQAANLAQTAKTKEQWDEVARYWVQAVAWMQAVPPNSPRRAFAEKKVQEYMRNLAYAQQQAASNSSAAAFPTFNSEPLDRQLQLYLSYLSTVGAPDILIVGSSRALQGVDPRQMKQSLAAKGYPGLKVFNFGVNGATAQVVEFMLTKLLTPDQLPQMILWADGVRAFNSGRIDRTHQSILESEGHQRLIAGVRPQLTPTESTQTSYCYNLPQQCQKSQKKWDQTPRWNSSGQSIQAVPVAFNSSIKTPQQLVPLIDRSNLKPTAILASLNAIDANGFLPLSNRYDPYTYYQRRPYVSGRYDGDYRAFNLGGKQAQALSSVMAFTKTHNIPVVFVNLPLTNDYLDGFRWWAEQEFRANMRYLSREYGFIFIDLLEHALNRYDYFVDPSHLNRYGAQSVARAVATQASVPWPRSQ